MKPGDGILQYLKNTKGKVDLPLNVLRQFQEFEKMLADDLDSYESQDPLVKRVMQSFQKFEILAIVLMEEEKLRSLKSCHNSIMERFSTDPLFEDGITLKTWIYFDFITQEINVPVAQKVAENADYLKEFIEAISSSYLGLYEIGQNDKKATKLKEYVTGRKVNLDQELVGAKKGNLIVGRVVNLWGNQFVFGDYGEFPQHTKTSLIEMIDDKIFYYYPEIQNKKEAYFRFMKNSGPYWFSIIAQEEGEIMAPDYYQKFYL